MAPTIHLSAIVFHYLDMGSTLCDSAATACFQRQLARAATAPLTWPASATCAAHAPARKITSTSGEPGCPTNPTASVATATMMVVAVDLDRRTVLFAEV